MIRSVSGDVAPDAVALALPHTHVLHRIAGAPSVASAIANVPASDSRSAAGIRNEDLVELRGAPAALGGQNLVLEKEDEAFRELEVLDALCQSMDNTTASPARPLVVDVTLPIEGRDEFMAKRVRLAEKLRMHIVSVTTYDLARAALPAGLSAQDQSERLAKTLETDLLFGLHADSSTAGTAGTSASRVCAGAIYQQVHIPAGGSMHASDMVVAHAIALAQQRTHAPVYLSFSHDVSTATNSATDAQQRDAVHREAICKWLQVLLERGAERSKLVVCHADQWCDELVFDTSSAPATTSYSFLQRLLELGVQLLFSMIGLAAVSDAIVINPCIAGVCDASASLAPSVREPPRDSAIAKCIARLIQTNPAYAAQLLLSSSVQQRIQYARYGGSGYAHAFTRFRERLLLYGVSALQIAQLTRTNPVQLLSWYVPPAVAAVPKDYLTCSICRSAFEPIVGEYFTKFTFTYCGTKCLRKHARQGFAPLST